MLINDRALGLNMAQKHVVNEVLTGIVAAKVIKNGDHVLDLGANVGYHTRKFSEEVGDSGLVHAFEPNPALWSTLLSFANTRVWPVAVGDRISVEKFILPIEHDQVGSIVDPRDFMGDVPTKILNVPQVTIDSLDEISSHRISFVKIDVERREEAALTGMTGLLARDQPIIVYENDTLGIQRVLGSAGYKTFDLLHFSGIGGVTANVVAIPSAIAETLDQVLPREDEIEALMESVG
jgi:FkbM family methyltransferase